MIIVDIAQFNLVKTILFYENKKIGKGQADIIIPNKNQVVFSKEIYNMNQLLSITSSNNYSYSFIVITNRIINLRQIKYIHFCDWNEQRLYNFKKSYEYYYNDYISFTNKEPKKHNIITILSHIPIEF